MANLIVCCDGTWNTPDQEDRGLPSPTNVVRLHGALAPRDAKGTPQHAYYRKGVGTSGSWLARKLGGGTGRGLSDDIKSAYHWICETYRAGDRLFLFGFSRGAYSARSLAGLVGKLGVMDFTHCATEPAQKWRRVERAYQAYRAGVSGQDWDNPLPRHAEVDIHFLGVWDTVGALGIPDEMLINVFDDPQVYRFHDTLLSARVRVARHAVSLDELRQSFAPTLWSAHHPTTDMAQVWFAGVHGDVGGSYADRGLGDHALNWMMTEATAQGLAFRPGARDQLRPDHHGAVHNSVTGMFTRMRTRPRSAPSLAGADSPLHDSARQRHRNAPLAQPAYWPTRHLAPEEATTCAVFAREPWNATGLFLEAGQSYRLEAEGEWLDASIHAGPEGAYPGFHIGKLAYALSAVPGALQRRKRRRSGDAGAITRGARREQDMPWFALVGALANGAGVDPVTQVLCPHQSFLIGKGCTLTPERSGYLYAFANDVWSFYGNNKGSLRLTVRRL